MEGRRADPYLDEGMIGFIHNTAYKEYWRVSRWYDDVADLVQDGYMIYAKCRARYVDVLGDLPQQPETEHRKCFMALVKTSYLRYIRYVIAEKLNHGGHLEIAVSQLARPGVEAPADPWEGVAAATLAEDVTLTQLVQSLPGELRALVTLLASDGADLLRRSRVAKHKTANGSTRLVRHRRMLRETTNEYWCRLVGLDPAENDLVGRLRAALG